MQKNSILKGLSIVFAATLLLWGGFYEFTAAFFSICLLFVLVICISSKKRIYIACSKEACGIYLLLFLYCVSIFFAKDKGMAVLGVFRILCGCLYLVALSQMEEEKVQKLTGLIPITGCMMVCISAIIYFIPKLEGFLFNAQRLGGTFQYSNTCALYFLLGIIVLCYSSKFQKREGVETGILLIGIILTGSRSVFVLCVLSIIYLLSTKIMLRKKMLLPICMCSAIVIAGIVVNSAAIARLGKMSWLSSTLVGRILYWQDALSLLAKHPFGLGYMGYFYMQPQIQTGNYTVKYVHNDFLHIGLDAGWIAMAVLVVIVVLSLFSQRIGAMQKHMMVLIALHGAFDFDLQFLSMFYIFIMCINLEAKKEICCSKQLLNVIGVICIGMTGYFTVALGAHYFGAENLSLQLYPCYTEAKKEKIIDVSGDTYKTADELIEKNGMLADAYAVKAGQYIKEGKYKRAMESLDLMLNCAGYNAEYYNQYVLCLSIGLNQAIQENEMKTAQEILECVQSVPERIETREMKTSKLGYMIKDKPKIEVNNEIAEYLDNLSGVSLYK